MQRSKQVSESIELGILLTLAGGFMDAYSFVCRGGVFASILQKAGDKNRDIILFFIK